MLTGFLCAVTAGGPSQRGGVFGRGGATSQEGRVLSRQVLPPLNQS